MNQYNETIDLELAALIQSPANFPEWFTFKWLISTYFKNACLLAFNEERLNEWRNGRDNDLPCANNIRISPDSGGSWDNEISNGNLTVGSYYIHNGTIAVISIYGFDAPLNKWESEYLALHNAKYNTNFINLRQEYTMF